MKNLTKPGLRCYECRKPIAEEDEVWVDPQTRKATTDGEPFHVACAPEEGPGLPTAH